MSETPQAWVEIAWAARDAANGTLNQARRDRFEGLKALFLESDLPKSVIHPNLNLVRYFKR
jgi:hypothetical protein